MSYYEMMIEQLLGSGAPQYGGEQGRRTAAADSSLVEDDMLRYQIGSKRKKGKNESIPSGSYALSWYPGQEMDIEMAPGRVIPADAEARMTKEQREYWQRKMAEWQNTQRSMVPKHGSGFIKNMLGGM